MNVDGANEPRGTIAASANRSGLHPAPARPDDDILLRVPDLSQVGDSVPEPEAVAPGPDTSPPPPDVPSADVPSAPPAPPSDREPAGRALPAHIAQVARVAVIGAAANAARFRWRRVRGATRWRAAAAVSAAITVGAVLIWALMPEPVDTASPELVQAAPPPEAASGAPIPAAAGQRFARDATELPEEAAWPGRTPPQPWGVGRGDNQSSTTVPRPASRGGERPSEAASERLAATSQQDETGYADTRGTGPAATRLPASTFRGGAATPPSGQQGRERRVATWAASHDLRHAQTAVARSERSATTDAGPTHRAELPVTAGDSLSARGAPSGNAGRDFSSSSPASRAQEAAAAGQAYPATDPATYMYIPGDFQAIRQALRDGPYQARDPRVPGSGAEARPEPRKADRSWPETQALRGVYR
jgi:hypothetical protein